MMTSSTPIPAVPVDDPPAHRATVRASLAVVALVALTWPLGLSVDIQDHDEGIYAEIAREMLENGLWAETPANFAPWYGHPFLTMVIMRASMTVFGVSALAARLPAIPQVVLQVVLTWWLTRRLAGRSAAWVAAALMAAVPATSLMGHNVKTDLNLMMGTSVATLLGAWALQRPWLWVPTGVFAAVGMLSKGPIGLMLPGAIVFALIAWERRWRELARAWPWLLAGLAAFLCTVLPWNLHMWNLFGDAWFNELYMASTFRRFGGAEASHKGDGTTPLYFFHTLAWAAAPALPFIILALWQRTVDLCGRWLRPPWPVLDLLWVLVPLSVLSMSSMKLPHYIFPVLPGLCAMAARAFEKWFSTQREFPRFSVLFRVGVLTVMALCTGFALAMVAICFPPREGVFLLGVFLLGAALVAVCVPGTWKGHGAWTLAGLCFSSALAMAMHNGAARPELARFSPARMVADALADAGAPRGAATNVLTYSEIWRMGIPFAAGVKIEEADLNRVVMEMTERSGGPAWVLCSLSEVEAIRERGFRVRVHGWGMTFPTSRLSIPFAQVENREDMARELLLVRVHRREG